MADVLCQRGFSRDAIDDAVLITSEAVTNAVLHAGTDIDVVVVADGAMARVEIHDGLPRTPKVAEPTTDSPSGRGLHVVAQLAEAWGVTKADGGKYLWFELRP